MAISSIISGLNFPDLLVELKSNFSGIIQAYLGLITCSNYPDKAQ